MSNRNQHEVMSKVPTEASLVPFQLPSTGNSGTTLCLIIWIDLSLISLSNHFWNKHYFCDSEFQILANNSIREIYTEPLFSLSAHELVQQETGTDSFGGRGSSKNF